MAAINEEDIITKGALQRPDELSKSLQRLVTEMDVTYKETMKLSTSIKDQSTSMNTLSNMTNKLVEQEKQQIKAQQAISQELLKTSMSADKYNSSITKLNDSLARNKKAYENLSNEAARNSDFGKRLQVVIDNQTKSLNELRRASDSAKTATKGHADAMAALDGTTGGLITRVKGLGSEFLSLAKSPWVLVAATIVGLFKALQSAAMAYYTATMQGEEDFAIARAKDEAFMDALSKSWADVGKQVADTWEKAKSIFRDLTKSIADIGDGGVSERLTEMENRRIYIEVEGARLSKEHLRDRIDDANTELKVLQLLEDAKSKDDFLASERLQKLREGNAILSEQEKGDLELAKADLDLQKEVVAYQSFVYKGQYDRNKSLLDMSDEEIVAIGAKGEEIKKLAALEEAYIKVQSDAQAKRVSRLKLELSLIAESVKESKEWTEFLKHIKELRDSGKSNPDELDFRLKNANPKTALDHLKEFTADQTKIEVQGAADRVEATRKEFEEKTAFWKKYGDNIGNDLKLQEELGFITKVREAYANFSQSLNALQDTLTNNRLMRIQQEQQANDDARDKELAAAGDNAEQKAAIEQKYTAKDKQLKREQAEAQRRAAIFDKSVAVIQAAITEAELILKALLAPTPLNIAAAIAGGIQVAAIAGKQIPAYRKGTKSAKGGPALVSEEGFEYVRPADGSEGWFTPMRQSIVDIPEGAEVVPHREAAKAAAMDGMRYLNSHDRSDSALQDLGKKIDTTNKLLKNKKELNINITEEGVRLELQRGARKVHFMSKVYN